MLLLSSVELFTPPPPPFTVVHYLEATLYTVCKARLLFRLVQWHPWVFENEFLVLKLCRNYLERFWLQIHSHTKQCKLYVGTYILAQTREKLDDFTIVGFGKLKA